MMIPMGELLAKAKEGYGVAAPNVFNREAIVFFSSKKLRAPIG